MNRLQQLLQDARHQNRKLLSVFVTAGFPEADATPEIVTRLAAAGADFFEIGIPFSDPLADGPAIQQASHVALQNGMTVSRVLEQVARIRMVTNVPILLMGYFNPILRFGQRRFVDLAAEAGVDGLIVPDLPPEECGDLLQASRERHLSFVFLVAPNTPSERLRRIDALTDSFVYCVSVTGVTGERSEVAAETVAFLERCKRTLRNPYLVGFGVSTGLQARQLSRLAWGVIIGSAIIKRLGGEGSPAERLDDAAKLVQEVKTALRSR